MKTYRPHVQPFSTYSALEAIYDQLEAVKSWFNTTDDDKTSGYVDVAYVQKARHQMNIALDMLDQEKIIQANYRE